jgi:O-antigen/teichoic acid export membrane protein
MNALMGRYLGTESYGTFAYSLTLASILAVIVPLGWPNVVMRLVTEYKETARWGLLRGILVKAFQITTGTSILASLILLAVSFLSAIPSHIALSLRFAALILPFVGLVDLRRKAFRGLLLVKPSILPDEILLPLLVIAGVILLDIHSALSAFIIYCFSALVVLMVASKWLLSSLPEGVREVKPVFQTKIWLSMALPMVLGGLSQLLMNRTDVLMLGAIDGMKTAGIYTAASKLAMLNIFALRAINTISAPMLASAHHRNNADEFQKILKSTMIWSLLAALPLTVIMLIWPQELLNIFGSGFTGGAPLLRILALGQFISASAGSLGFALLMSGKERKFAYSTVTLLVVNIVGNVLVIPIYGAVGAACITGISIASLTIWQLQLVRP